MSSYPPFFDASKIPVPVRHRVQPDLGGRDLVWHYTNTAGVIGILERCELWASSAMLLNDLSEIQMGTELVRQAFERSDLVLGHGASLLYNGWRIDATERSDKVLHTYVLSASNDGDSLSMWRGYGAGDVGYAVGLFGTLQPASSSPTYGDIPQEWLAVEYDSNEQHRLIQECVALVIELGARIDLGVTNHEQQTMLNEIYRGIERLIYRIKDPAFRDEKETRVVFPAGSSEGDFVRYRSSRFGITPYIGLRPFRVVLASGEITESRLPIVHIRVGPSPHQRQAELALMSLLDDHGYGDVYVDSTGAPFR